MVKTPDGIVLPALPEGYSWSDEDGDYNIIRGKELKSSELICYVRILLGSFIVRCYIKNHPEQRFNNLQDAINVMTTNFTLGIYFEDETS